MIIIKSIRKVAFSELKSYVYEFYIYVIYKISLRTQRLLFPREKISILNFHHSFERRHQTNLSIKPNHHWGSKKNKGNKGQIQRKTKSIDKSLANLFMQSGNPGKALNIYDIKTTFRSLLHLQVLILN